MWTQWEESLSRIAETRWFTAIKYVIYVVLIFFIIALVMIRLASDAVLQWGPMKVADAVGSNVWSARWWIVSVLLWAAATWGIAMMIRKAKQRSHIKSKRKSLLDLVPPEPQETVDPETPSDDPDDVLPMWLRD